MIFFLLSLRNVFLWANPLGCGVVRERKEKKREIDVPDKNAEVFFLSLLRRREAWRQKKSKEQKEEEKKLL